MKMPATNTNAHKLTAAVTNILLQQFPLRAIVIGTHEGDPKKHIYPCFYTLY